MWIPLLLSMSLFFAGFRNLWGREASAVYATIELATALYLLEVWRCMVRHHEQAREFREWLLENRAAIQSGDAVYGTIPITEQTEVKQYQAAVSFVHFSTQVPSRYYIGHETSEVTWFNFTHCSVLIGWWGIPWGPVNVLRAVFANLRGGKTSTVGELLAEMAEYQKDVIHLTERAAEAARRIMEERGFPTGTAMQVEVQGDPGFLVYAITYDDQPPSDGSVWRSEASGVAVIVRRRDASRLEGLTIDFKDGDFLFQNAWNYAKKTQVGDR